MPADGDRMAMLTAAAAAVVTVAIVGAVATYIQKYLSTTVGKHVGFDLRHMLYHHIQRLSLSFYESRRTGDMVVRLTSDIDAVEDFITNAVLGIAAQPHHARRHGRRDDRHGLEVQHHRAVDRAAAVRARVSLHRPDQGGDARGETEGRRARLGRAGVDHLGAHHQDIRARGIRGEPSGSGGP